MGRNKFSQREIDIICILLKRKIAGNRGGQKMVRHTLRTVLNFNISDFNVQGSLSVRRQCNEYHSKYNTCKRQENTIFWISLIFIFAPERRIPKIQKRVGNVKK